MVPHSQSKDTYRRARVVRLHPGASSLFAWVSRGTCLGGHMRLGIQMARPRPLNRKSILTFFECQAVSELPTHPANRRHIDGSDEALHAALGVVRPGPPKRDRLLGQAFMSTTRTHLLFPRIFRALGPGARSDSSRSA